MEIQERKQITVMDLADHLKVSHTTVRKALNGLPGISAATRQRIKAVADKMGYYPNLMARNLKQQQSNFLGLVITKSLREIWYASIVDRLIASLKSKGYSVMLSLVDRGSPEEIKETLGGLLGGHVAGIIAGPIIRQADLEPFDIVEKNGLPLVMFDCIEEISTSSVAIDHVSGLKQIISHLVEFGHKRIGYLCCDVVALPNTRKFGFEQALFEFDLPLIGKDMVTGKSTFEGGYLTMKKRIEDAPDDLPTAFFCHSDICALGAVKALREKGMKVPDDVSLIGYDDIPEASYGYPALTTVGGVIEKITETMADLLLASINGEMSIPQRVLIEPKLIKRESVAKASP